MLGTAVKLTDSAECTNGRLYDGYALWSGNAVAVP